MLPWLTFPKLFRGVREFGEAARAETLVCVAFGGIGQLNGAETIVCASFCKRRQNGASLALRNDGLCNVWRPRNAKRLFERTPAYIS